MTINSRWSLNESVLTFETKPNRNADVYQELVVLLLKIIVLIYVNLKPT